MASGQDGREQLSDDERALQRLVDIPTFDRGWDYAHSGAVLGSRWLSKDLHVYGEVAGNDPTPYTSWVRLKRSSAGVLISFQGTCTCPVHLNCKHSVALLIDALAGLDEARAAVPVIQAWEKPLRELLREDPGGTDDQRIGLQFEVIAATRSHRTGLSSPRRLGMRPVTSGRREDWIRSGISWQSLSPQWGSMPGVQHEYLRLLREIVAMDTAARTGYYGATGPLIYLDALPSKRIWDVLAEATALGLPMVTPGRLAAVRLLEEPATVSVEIGRSGDDLVLRPTIHAGGERLDPRERLLLGDPVSGVGWWAVDGAPSAFTDGDVRLARFGEPIDPVLRSLIDLGQLVIPAADEAAFFAQYYPALQQRARLVSTDLTVDLPEPQPPLLVLTLDYGEATWLNLSWHWDYFIGSVARREPLWPTLGSARARELEQESLTVKAVETAAGPLFELLTRRSADDRLAAGTLLVGFDAVRFISDVLPALRQLPGLEIETSGTPRDYREALTAPVVAVEATTSAADRDWLDLSVTITVDGEDVPFDRLFVALANDESHLVLPSGVWFSLDRPELAALAALIAEARELNDSGPQTARVSRYQAGLWDDLEKLEIVTGQVDEWRSSLSALSEITSIDQPPLPAGIAASLRSYQSEGFAWLAFLHAHRLGGVLADEMGLGKTLQAITLMTHAKQHGETAPFLVVAPTSVVYNWQAECDRFAPDLDVRIITETGKRRIASIAEVADGADVIVTSYALFRLEFEHYASVRWAGLILDEAQFAKNAKSRTYRCAKLLPAPFKLAITGTPMENNLMELWSLLSITAPGLFPTSAGFERHYRGPIEKDNDRDRMAQLRRRLRPLMLRRTKEQVVSDLPSKQEQVVDLPLNPKHRKIYETHLQRERQKVLGLLGNLEKNRFEIFRSLTLLRQASLDPVLIDPRYANVPSTKLDALMELLTEISSEGHRTLVFSQFTRFLGNAKARLDEAKIDYCYLDGSTRRRPEVIEAFRTGTAPVFLISLKAGGFGLNLTEADYCVLLDPWWNPATEAQAVDRIHRIGQTRKVMVYRLVAKDTIEEKVMALKARKAALFDSVMADGGASPGALTAADIRGILE